MTDENTEAEFEKDFAAFSAGDEPAGEEEPTSNDDDGMPDDEGQAAEAEEAATDPEKDEKAGAEEPEPEEAKTETADPWKDAPEALREQFNALKAERDQLDHNYRSQQGRIAPLMRKEAEARAEIERLMKAQAAPPAAGTTGQKDGDEDPLAALREDYPEVAGPIEQLLASQREQIAKLEGKLGDFDENYREEHVKRQIAELSGAHPDWVNVASSGQFVEWILGQPQFVQDAFDRNRDQITNAAEASSIISMFKQQQPVADAKPAQSQPDPKPQSGKRDLQRRAANAPDNRAASSGAAKQIPDDFENAFKHFAQQ